MSKETYTKEEMEKEKAEALVAYKSYMDSVSAYHNIFSGSHLLEEEDSENLLKNVKKTIDKAVGECKSKMPKRLFDKLNIG